MILQLKQLGKPIWCQFAFVCIKLVQLILKEIIKIVATRCKLLRLICTKFDFGWGSALDRAARPSSWIGGTYY